MRPNGLKLQDRYFKSFLLEYGIETDSHASAITPYQPNLSQSHRLDPALIMARCGKPGINFLPCRTHGLTALLKPGNGPGKTSSSLIFACRPTVRQQDRGAGLPQEPGLAEYCISYL